MTARFRRRIAVAILVGMSLSSAAWAAEDTRRPFTADDLLSLESLGAVRISPDGRWTTIEHAAPYDTAAQYDGDYGDRTAITDLEIRNRAGVLVHVLRHDAQQGFQSGPYSPDGARMAVFRLTADRKWRIGLLTLETGRTAWLDLTPESSLIGRAVAWRSPDELVLIARADDDLPILRRIGWQSQALTSQRWRDAGLGKTATGTFVVSGPGRDQRPQAAASRLVSFKVSTGEFRTWATGEIVDMELSPDGSNCALLMNGQDLQTPGAGPAKIGTPTRRRRLQVVKFATGALQDPFPAWDLLSHLVSWSPDSRSLVTFGRQGSGPFSEGALLRYDAAVGTGRPMRMEGGRPVVLETREAIPFVRLGWTGETPVVWSEDRTGQKRWRALAPDGRWRELGLPDDPDAEWGWRAGAARVTAAGRRWSVSGGQAVDLGEGRLLPASTASDMGGRGGPNPDPRDLGADSVTDDRACLHPAQDPVWCPPSLAPDESPIAADSAGSLMITRQTDVQGVTRLRRYAPHADPATVLEINGFLKDVRWGQITPIAHTGYDGRPLTSWLLEPPGVRPAAGWPTVAVVYPRSVFDTAPRRLLPGADVPQFNPAVVAAAGYAVLFVSLPTHQDDPGPGLETVADDIWRAVGAGGQMGLIDPGRVALFGHSYGGHAALLAATQTDRFRTIIASAGLADYAAFNRSTYHFAAVPEDGYVLGGAGWLEGGQGRMQKPAWADPAAYVANSPLYLADRIRAPTLIIAGDLDPVSADAMFANLYQLGRVAGLLTFWGEEHVLRSPANIRLLHEKLLAWLDLYMAPTTS